MEINQAFSLIIISLAVFIVPILSRYLKIPSVVGEILFGVAIGKSGLGLVISGEWLSFLAQFGFFLLMFLSGFEIDFEHLKKQGRGQVVFALSIFFSTFLLAYLFSALMGFCFYMAFILSTTSLGLVIPTLRETGLSRSLLGQNIILAAIIANFMTLFGIIIYSLFYQYGFSWKMLKPGIIFIFAASVLYLFKRLAWWYPERFAQLLKGEDPVEIGVRASLALLFVFVGFSCLLDIEPIIGAFIGGALFSLIFRYRGVLEEKLMGFSYGFLIPIFFIHVGINFDLQVLLDWQIFLNAVALFFIAWIVKIIPSLLFCRKDLSLRECLSCGILLSARLCLIIAAASIGLKLNLISHQIYSSIILLAVLMASIAPILFKKLQSNQAHV
ncbi:MAG: cation:proton antiporter [Proteobacteria bacterium]|nr:cation:proton antiporter [Pseudomonadota bacterium]MBU4504287.1 cation:proton antiporter [Pseudomonadota bacterium]